LKDKNISLIKITNQMTTKQFWRKVTKNDVENKSGRTGFKIHK
jgi:hypothetical protein